MASVEDTLTEEQRGLLDRGLPPLDPKQFIRQQLKGGDFTRWKEANQAPVLRMMPDGTTFNGPGWAGEMAAHRIGQEMAWDRAMRTRENLNDPIAGAAWNAAYSWGWDADAASDIGMALSPLQYSPENFRRGSRGTGNRISAPRVPARKPTAKSSQSSAQRNRNRYPDFERVPSPLQPVAEAMAARLTQQLNGRLKIPGNRVLAAPWVGSSPSSTSAGWLRAEGKFWTEFKQAFPTDYDLMGPGHTVTPKLAQLWGWPKSTVGQKLVHHHIANGSYVVALPENIHREESGDIHATPRIEGSP